MLVFCQAEINGIMFKTGISLYMAQSEICTYPSNLHRAVSDCNLSKGQQCNRVDIVYKSSIDPKVFHKCEQLKTIALHEILVNTFLDCNLKLCKIHL